MRRYVLSRLLYEAINAFLASSVASLAIFALLPVLEPMIDLLTGY
jgi:membrane-associated HD superfamily phosphohydrolase